jgi:hypothetical protein
MMRVTSRDDNGEIMIFGNQDRVRENPDSLRRSRVGKMMGKYRMLGNDGQLGTLFLGIFSLIEILLKNIEKCLFFKFILAQLF